MASFRELLESIQPTVAPEAAGGEPAAGGEWWRAPEAEAGGGEPAGGGVPSLAEMVAGIQPTTLPGAAPRAGVALPPMVGPAAPVPGGAPGRVGRPSLAEMVAGIQPTTLPGAAPRAGVALPPMVGPAAPGAPGGGRPWMGAPTPWTEAAGAAGAPAWDWVSGRLGMGAAGMAASEPSREVLALAQEVGRAGLGGRPEWSAAQEWLGKRLQEAWEPVTGPIEETRLPEAWERLQAAMGAAAAVEAAGEAQYDPLGMSLSEEQARIGEEQAGALTGMVGAGWHGLKQIPWAGTLFRGAEALGKTAMAALQAPALGIEEALGRGVTQRRAGAYGFWALQPAKHLTEEQQARAERVAEEQGKPLWLVQQVLLAEERGEAPSVREYAVATYGAGPELERTLSRLALGLGYSSYEAQVKGLERLMAGEELDTVTSGRQLNTYEPGAEDVAAFRSYVEGVRRREGDAAADAAAQRVVETGLIPGESDMWNEMLFQIALDPLNLLDIGTWSKGIKARQARATGRFAEVALAHADEVADGAKLALSHVDEAAVALGRSDEAQQVGALRQLLDKVNPFAPTPRAQAEVLAGTAYQVASPAVMRIEGADEARAMVRALAEDPGKVVGALGNVPLSQAADEARPLLAAVVDNLDDAKQFPSLARGGEFDRMAFLGELDGAMMDAAMDLTGAVAVAEAEKAQTGYRKFVNGFRSTMSEFYLRTPGYAVRNAVGDLMTMAWDGVASFDGRGAIDDFFKRFGPTTRRVSRPVAAGAQVGELGGVESRLPGVLKKISGGAGRIISGQEEARYTRAYYTGLQQALKRVWSPTLPDELRLLLDDDVVQMIERGLAQGMNGDEFAEVIRRATGEGPGLMDVARYLDDPDDLSVGLRLHLEAELGKVTDVEGVGGVMDEAVEMVREQASRAFAADPTPPGRQAWSDVGTVEDLREEQGWIEGLGSAMGVPEEEATAAAQQLEDMLRAGEVRIREAEETLAAAAAGQFDEDAANLMRMVRSETGRAKMVTRTEADRLRAETWKLAGEMIDQGKSPGPVWRQYFATVGQLHADNQAEVVARLGEGLEQLKRLGAGEGFEAVMGRPVQRVVEESLESLRALAGDVAGRKERLRRLGLEEFVDFDKMLDAQRLTIDTAEAEAWRLVAINPSRDGLDIVMGVQENVDRLARAAATEMAEVRARYLNHQISREKFVELGNAIWGGYFRNGSQGWDLARWELAQLPLSEGAQLRGLQALGWPAEEVAKLRPDELQAVLGTGVRWDAMLGAPTMEIAEAMKGTVAEVAGGLGLDLSRSADWGADEWGQVEDAARRLQDEAGVRASMAGRMTGAAVAEAAGEAAGAPGTVAAGTQLVWPSSVDDVARSLGIRPQTAGAGEWELVAQYADEQGQMARMLGDEFGRRSTAALEAEGVKEAAFGVGMEPESAAAYRWMELAEEARGLGGGGGHVVAAPGMYDAAGLPVSREMVGRRGRPQLAVVEAAEAMVPQAELVGRGRATVGFEQRQAWLAERYGDVAEMARARAGLLQDGRRLGEAVDVPADVVRVTTRKERGLYFLDLEDEKKFVVRTYVYDAWPEARMARDEARKIVEAGQQGQQAMTGTAWSAWGTEDVMKADRRAAAAGGYAGAPTLADAAAAQEQAELAALERIRAGLSGDWERVERMGEGVSPVARKRLMDWAEGGLARDWTSARTTAVEMARDTADYALLDYSGGRKRFDNWLGLVFPYTYWKTRSGRNWLLRFMERPGALAAYGRYREAMERKGQERGYRGRFEGQVGVEVPGMAEWTGREVFFDPTSLLMPWSQVMGPEWVGDPADAENTVEMLHKMTQRLGLRTYGFIEWSLQYAGWIGKKEEIGYVIPQTGGVQALTAAAGVGPPGGVSMEAPLRRGLGLPEQEPYQAYRVMRMLGNMAGEEPGLTEPALRAQELQRLVEAGELGLNEAMGWERGRPRGRPLASTAVARVGRDQGWSEEELEEAQGLLQEAVRRAGLERGLRTGTSFFAGVPLSMYPAGERTQVELEREQRGEMYSPLTGRGSREEMLRWREAHPETVPRRVARAGLPGAGEYEGWTPGEAVRSQEYYERRDEINETYDQAVDDLLRREPWNKAGVRELEEQRQAELDVVRDELGMEAAEGEAYRPWSVYGAGPEEAGGIRREEVLAAVSAAKPRVGDFADDEGVTDYEAYNAAVDSFFGDLAAGMAGDERLAAISGALAEEVGGVGRGVAGMAVPAVGAERLPGAEGLLEGIDREAVEEYWRRNDRPLAAVQRVWEDTVYGPAREAYNRAVEGGVEKGQAYEDVIEAAGEVTGADLIGEIEKAYPGRWTAAELRAALKGVRFPSVGEASVLRKPPEERALAQAQGAFWDYLNDELPPGKLAAGAKDHTLVQLVLDAETRGTATAEQYQKALEFMQGWRAKNFDVEKWGTEAEWAEARGLNEELNELVERELPGVQEVLSEYYDLSSSERKAFKKEHPEIGEYYDLRDWWGEQAGHEVWARFYLGETGGAARTTWQYGKAYEKKTYKKSYRRWGGGGGGWGRGGAGEEDWKFGYQARRVPYGPRLETPSAWEGALRERFKPYKYQSQMETKYKPARYAGQPWMVGKWSR